MNREIVSVPISFANSGIIIKSSPDEIPITAYKMLSNAQTDRENSVSVRKGFGRLNAGLPAAPYSSYYLKDSDNRQWRYAITNGQLYVAPIVDPEDAAVWPLASHNYFGAVIGGENLSVATDPRALWATFSLRGTETKPYAFMADGTKFLKHCAGMASARRVGIPKPMSPITNVALSSVTDVLIDACEDYTTWTGGDSSKTSAADYPSIWWYGVGTSLARWIWAKYTFVLNDGTETFSSAANLPNYIPSGKTSKLFWKKAKYTYHSESTAGNNDPNITIGVLTYPNHYFSDAEYASVPDGVRVRGVRLQAGSMIDRIQVLWESSDGTASDGPFHGGGGGDLFEFMLDFDEYIIELKGRYDTYVNSLTIVTNKRESQKYGGDGGTADYSVTLPAGDSLQSKMLIGFTGRHAGVTDFQNKLTAIGMATRYDTYDNTSSAPVAAVGYNLYVGETPNSLYKVNEDPIDLADPYLEPPGGWVYGIDRPPMANVGDLSNDAAGETTNAVKISLTGAGKLGRALKALVNDIGYPIVSDFGTMDPDESFKISIKFADATALSNCASIRLNFVLSDIPGDTGDKYNYIATAEVTDFSGHTPGSWQQIQIYKSSFVLNNYSGSALINLGWDTVTAVSVEVVTKDPVVGAGTCVVSFDNIYFSPVGKLNGADLEWTYTFYNSKTDTESDYADSFANTLGTLVDKAVELSFPSTPLTNAPMANPDKIRIYRMGGTITQFQRVAEIDYVAGFPFSYVDNIGDESLGDVLETDNQLPPENVEGVEIFDDRLWTWGGVSLEGIAEPGNWLRFSKGARIEHFPSDNYVIVGSGNEKIMRVFEHDGELFIFTLTKVYRIVGQNGDYKAVSTAVNQGIKNKFAVCRGARGLYMRSYDGIWEFPNGRKISEPINQVFFGETVNGIEPVAADREDEEAMAFWNSMVFFSYCATTDASIRNDRTLIWDTQHERWFWYIYGAQNLYQEPETDLLIGANLTQWYSVVPGVPVTVRRSGAYPIRMEYGTADECSDGSGYLVRYGIPCIIDTKEFDLGFPDQEKQFIDITVDADTQGYPITLQASFDDGEYEVIGIIQTAARGRVVFPFVMGDENSKMATRMTLRISFESDPDADSSTRIFKVVHRVLIEPQKHRTFVTDWDYCGHQGPKFLTKFWVEMDTFGVPLLGIEAQGDHEVIKTIVDNVTADGRKKFYYGLGLDKRFTLARLKFLTDGDNEVKVYDYGFEIIPEPPLINSLQTSYTDNGFPYRKLWKHVEMDIDTDGKLIEFNFWLDNEIKQTFNILTSGRQKITQSLDQNLFGKIGRITVDVDGVGTDGLPQGIRLYADPIFITEQRNPDVTIADSFEQVLSYERIKVLKQLFYVLENPNESVTMQLYIDGSLRVTYTLTANTSTYPDISIRRQDFPTGMKGKLFRFVFTSNQAFEIDWPRSQVVLRDVNTEETHRRPRLEPPQTY
jgi:hypothetical protein